MHRKDYKDFFYSFKNNTVYPKFKNYVPYKDALHNIFRDMNLYFSVKVSDSDRFVEKIVRLVTRNNNYEVIDESLIDVIRNSRVAYLPNDFYDLLSSIVEPKYVAKENINTLVRSFYILLIDIIYQWEDAVHDKEFITPYSRIKLVEFKRLMLYIFSRNVDEIFNHTKYSVRDDATKLFLFCNILAYVYLNKTRYDLIDTFLSNSDYFLEKLRINGIDYEPGYSNLDPEMGKKLFNFVEDFFRVSEKKKILS